jgi:hypothetical protein
MKTGIAKAHSNINPTTHFRGTILFLTRRIKFISLTVIHTLIATYKHIYQRSTQIPT